MRFRKNRGLRREQGESVRTWRREWARILASLAVGAAVAGAAVLWLAQSSSAQGGGGWYRPTAPLPDGAQQIEMRDQEAKKQNFEAANTERKKLIGEESALLLKLATELKAEVDKTNKDTLSIAVIRKADAIEKLARDVQAKMKLTVGTN